MRFVPTFCLKAGMILARPIYGMRNELLLAGDCMLTESGIKSIHRLQINGAYIEDDISKNIEIENVISDTLKNEVVKRLQNLFIGENVENKEISSQMKELKKKIEDIIDDIINNKDCMVNIIDLKVFDQYTYYHSINVTIMSIILGMALGLSKIDLYKLGVGALLHDIGIVFVDKRILDLPFKLSDEEYEQVKLHSSLGYNYVKEKFDIPIESRVAILEHHERYDGSGYPLHKVGEDISRFARIIAIADTYDAMLSDRPYRKAILPSETMEYMMGGSSTLFDPDYIMTFTRKVAPYPIGTCVKLSNNLTGIIVKNNNDCPLRPVVKMLKNGDCTIDTPFEIDLKNSAEFLSTTIVGIADM